MEKSKQKKRRKQIKIEKIGTYNVRGLGASNKQHLFKQVMEEGQWDILGISETKLKQDQARFFFQKLMDIELLIHVMIQQKRELV